MEFQSIGDQVQFYRKQQGTPSWPSERERWETVLPVQLLEQRVAWIHDRQLHLVSSLQEQLFESGIFSISRKAYLNWHRQVWAQEVDNTYALVNRLFDILNGSIDPKIDWHKTVLRLAEKNDLWAFRYFSQIEEFLGQFKYQVDRYTEEVAPLFPATMHCELDFFVKIPFLTVEITRVRLIREKLSPQVELLWSLGLLQFREGHDADQRRQYRESFKVDELRNRLLKVGSNCSVLAKADWVPVLRDDIWHVDNGHLRASFSRYLKRLIEAKIQTEKELAEVGSRIALLEK